MARSRRSLGPADAILRWIYVYLDRHFGEDQIMQVIPDDFKGKVRLVPRSKAGNVTTYDESKPLVWEQSGGENACKVTPIEGSFYEARIEALGPLAGPFQIRATGDGDKGEGMREIVTQDDFQVVAGEAFNAGFEVESDPVEPPPQQ
jgi:hypothetical protein